MARIASLLVGLALVVGQPVATAMAQPTESTQNDRNKAPAYVPGGVTKRFFSDPGKILIALGGLSALTWGLVNAFHNGHHRQPASP